MEQKDEQIAETCELCGRPTTVTPDPSELEDAETAGIRPPALMEITTPGGRVWYVANLN